MAEPEKRQDDRHGAAPAVRPVDNITLGLVLMFVSVIIAPMIDVFGKLATATIPPAEVAFFRFLFQSLLMLPFVLHHGTWRQITFRRMPMHAFRGAILAISMIAFVTTLRVMAVADAIAIFFVEPIMLTILGGLFLKETIGWRRYMACAVGFGGAMLIIRPSFNEIGLVAILPVVTAFGIAVFALLTRVLAHREDAWSMQMQTGIWGAVFCGVLLFFGHGTGSVLFDPVIPGLKGLSETFGVGVWATVSGTFAIYAYRNAPAATLAPMQYFEIVCATVVGWLVFGDFPDTIKWLGISIIIASGLFILWRERVVAARISALSAQSAFNP